MFIHDFHAKLSSRNEPGDLFEALRLLRRLADFRSVLFSEEASGGGWNPWMDGNAHHRHAIAEA